MDEDDATTLGDLVPDRSAKAPEYLVMSGMLREKMESILATLEPDEEQVIRLRFGFEDGTVHTQEQIGRVFSWDTEEVRLTEAKAMRKLRHPSRSGQLVGFLN
ncbi:RNA polymerase sigma factor SigA [bioreactor metagenome]|uniref:RNA polymerase sigma factor SigA n=1 Tax=bioreactor metagenome TaxID=1076179 RepID=A0A645EMH2_9ZZZZ